jgi:hypothetical protein
MPLTREDKASVYQERYREASAEADRYLADLRNAVEIARQTSKPYAVILAEVRNALEEYGA